MTAWSAEWIDPAEAVGRESGGGERRLRQHAHQALRRSLGHLVRLRPPVCRRPPSRKRFICWALPWMLWLLSLTCCLWSHATSGLTMEKAIRRGDAGDIPDGGGCNTATLGLNIGGGVCFVVATFLAAVFMILNLGG